MEPQNQAPVKEEPLFSWTAYERPFKKRSREYYTSLIAVAAVIGVVLFLVEGYMPVVMLSALVFLFYILNTIPPKEISYQLTNLGIIMDTVHTPWEALTRFWFTSKGEGKVVVFETLTFPGRLELVIKETDLEKVKEIASKYLREEKATPSFPEKLVEWFASKMPGN